MIFSEPHRLVNSELMQPRSAGWYNSRLWNNRTALMVLIRFGFLASFLDV